MVDRNEAERLLHEYDRRMERGHSAQSLTSARHHFEQAEEIRAAVLNAMTPQWRDTETDPPPKDQPVLLYCPDRGSPTNPARIELEPYWTSRGSLHAWATHWQPLPDAPEAPK